ncbi:MAG: DUF2584 family protein [Candidatus Dojkabacteria bacterium]|nr:MAG: DUF2584 family protein [Candidatus Dojkabacteria bacterium]
MSTPINLNALLSLPEDFSETLEIDKVYTIRKSGYRITPIKMPMELSDSDHKYIGKVVVLKLEITAEYTDITFKVLKLFSVEESEVFSRNFLRY